MSNDDAEDVIEGDVSRRGWREIVFAWLGLGFAAVALATLLGFGARWNGFAELFVHFKLVYFWAMIVAALSYAIIGRWRWVAASVVVLGIHAPGILGWYVARDDVHAVEHEPNVRVLIANVMTRPDGYEEVIDYIRERDPDVVLLQEISVDRMRR